MPQNEKTITWTPNVCRIIAFYRIWTIILPTFGGLGTTDPKSLDPQTHNHHHNRRRITLEIPAIFIGRRLFVCLEPDLHVAVAAIEIAARREQARLAWAVFTLNPKPLNPNHRNPEPLNPKALNQYCPLLHRLFDHALTLDGACLLHTRVLHGSRFAVRGSRSATNILNLFSRST